MKKMLLLILIMVSIGGAQETYILCEGNFGSSNASLWHYDGSETDGPVYWNLGDNPLGDVGQSLTYYENNLFVVVNNSHKIDVLNSKTQDLVTTIELPSASPRYLKINNNRGYLSCWNLAAILVLDMQDYEILDTLEVGALPEDIVINNDILYTSINMDMSWNSETAVYAYDLTAEIPALVDSFEVVAGPGKMILKDQELFVASTYYDDAWNTYAGMSKINLETGTVETSDYGVSFNFSDDLVAFNNRVYRAYRNGMVKINDDCSYDAENIVGSLGSAVYAMEANNGQLYLGHTDYTAPDTVVVFDSEMAIVDELKVGALPTDLSFIPTQNNTENRGKTVTRFRLNQNYPNPFNPITTIEYMIPKSSTVKLSVYDMLGNHVVDLVNSAQTAGNNSVQWNALDSQGNSVSTGVYFYRLTAGDMTRTKKMIFLK